MNIAFCINNAYAEKVAVVMTSLLENNSSSFLNIYIFSSDLSEENLVKLKKLHLQYKNFQIQKVAVPSEKINSLKLKIGYISKETYYRYLIAELLPELDKILYLDADLIICKEITSFYKTNLDNCYLAGAEDLFIKQTNYKKEIGLSGNDLYINAGVLLMNLKQLRHDKIGDRLISRTQDLGDKIKYQDQDILNLVCHGKIKKVDSVYNFAMQNIKKEKSKIKNACIIHYTGEKKPWNTPKLRQKKVWEKYSKKALTYLDKKIKVGLLIDEFFGGARTVYGGYGFLARYFIAKYIPSSEIQVDVLLGKGRKAFFTTKFHEDNVDLYRLPRKKWFAKRWLKKQKYDIYLSIELTNDWVLRNETNPDTKLILWIQDPRPQYEWDEIKTMTLMPEPCYYNQKIYDLVNDWYKKSRIKFITQAHCLNPKAIDLYNLNKNVHITYVPNPIEIDNDFNVKTYKKQNKIIFLGRLEDVKRGWLFCEIAKSLPEYEFHVLGKANKSKEKNIPVFEKYKGLPNLHFEGLVVGEEKKQFLKDAKILINTSIHEALPVSFLEALSYGVCLVSNRNPDSLTEKFGVWTGDVLGNGFDKVDLYVKAVKKIMENESLRQKMAESAREYICQNHNIAKVTQTLRELIMKETEEYIQE